MNNKQTVWVNSYSHSASLCFHVSPSDHVPLLHYPLTSSRLTDLQAVEMLGENSIRINFDHEVEV